MSDQAPAAAGDMAEINKNMAALVCSIDNRDESKSEVVPVNVRL